LVYAIFLVPRYHDRVTALIVDFVVTLFYGKHIMNHGSTTTLKMSAHPPDFSGREARKRKLCQGDSKSVKRPKDGLLSHRKIPAVPSAKLSFLGPCMKCSHWRLIRRASAREMLNSRPSSNCQLRCGKESMNLS